jgi:hypothetical protein
MVDRYFDNRHWGREQLEDLAYRCVEDLYFAASEGTHLDEHYHSYFKHVVGQLWRRLSELDLRVFYILDNTIRDDRLQAYDLLFRWSGFFVLMPYMDGAILPKDVVLAVARRAISEKRHLIYIEKDSQVNYLDDVMTLARQNRDYRAFFRNQSSAPGTRAELL